MFFFKREINVNIVMLFLKNIRKIKKNIVYLQLVVNKSYKW